MTIATFNAEHAEHADVNRGPGPTQPIGSKGVLLGGRRRHGVWIDLERPAEAGRYANPPSGTALQDVVRFFLIGTKREEDVSSRRAGADGVSRSNVHHPVDDDRA